MHLLPREVVETIYEIECKGIGAGLLTFHKFVNNCLISNMVLSDAGFGVVPDRQPHRIFSVYEEHGTRYRCASAIRRQNRGEASVVCPSRPYPSQCEDAWVQVVGEREDFLLHSDALCATEASRKKYPHKGACGEKFGFCLLVQGYFGHADAQVSDASIPVHVRS